MPWRLCLLASIQALQAIQRKVDSASTPCTSDERFDSFGTDMVRAWIGWAQACMSVRVCSVYAMPFEMSEWVMRRSCGMYCGYSRNPQCMCACSLVARQGEQQVICILFRSFVSFPVLAGIIW